MRRLRVDRAKAVDYLLEPGKSRGKATFFLRLGFRPEQWEVLAEALKAQAALAVPVATFRSAYGTRYSIDGEIDSPDGRVPRARVRTVWIEEAGSSEWRLITAHPV